MSRCKIVQTGPKIQFGGLNHGLFRSRYQSSGPASDKMTLIPGTANEMATQTKRVTICLIILLPMW